MSPLCPGSCSRHDPLIIQQVSTMSTEKKKKLKSKQVEKNLPFLKTNQGSTLKMNLKSDIQKLKLMAKTESEQIRRLLLI